MRRQATSFQMRPNGDGYPTLADEDEEVAGEGVERECAAHEGTESVVPTPQVDGFGGQVHLGAGCNAQHDDRNAPTSAAM